MEPNTFEVSVMKIFKKFELLLIVMQYYDYWDLSFLTFSILNRQISNKVFKEIDVISREFSKESVSIF
jgi:hypothetical protein